MTASLEADASAQAPKALQKVSCISYSVQFQEDQPEIKALINFSSEVNTITPAYVIKLELTARKTSVRAQKINSSPLEIDDMVSASFLLHDSLERVRFFEKTFLLANTSMEVVLGMPFLFLNNTNDEFAELEKLTWRSYMAAKTLPTTNRVEFIGKREFAKATLDENSKTLVEHVVVLEAETSIYPLRAAQIATLQWDKTLTEISAKYSDYADVFSLDLAMELSENMGINEHIIELIDEKQPLYGPIYALSSVELEILKTYIEIYLKTRFI